MLTWPTLNRKIVRKSLVVSKMLSWLVAIDRAFEICIGQCAQCSATGTALGIGITLLALLGKESETK